MATIVVINVIATFLLLQKVGRKTATPSLKKKTATALWRSEPIVPRHDPPKVAGGDYHGMARDVDRRFFADFRDFAGVVNWWLADDFSKSRDRLQDLPDGDLSLNVDFSHGPMLGRSFAIYHNQTHVGRLEVHPSNDYTTETPLVYTNIQIDWARFFGHAELTTFLWALATHVTSQREKGDERMFAWQSINNALTKTLWDHYRISQYDKPGDTDSDWGDLELSFQGTADFYIDRVTAPAWREQRAAEVGAPRRQ